MTHRQRAELCQMRPANATAGAWPSNRPDRGLFWKNLEISPERGGPGSADCKLALQAPINARAMLESANFETSGEDFRDDSRAG